MAKKHTFLTVTLLSLVPIHSQARAPGAVPARGQNYDASLVTPPPRSATRAASPVVALARDPVRGTPTMFIAPHAAAPPTSLSAEAAARHHLMNHLDAYKVSREAMTGTRVRFVHDLGRGGIVVALRQTLAGVELFHGDIKVLLAREDHRLLAISGAPHPAAVPGNRRKFALSRPQAITAALADLHDGARALTLTPTGERSGGWERFTSAGSSELSFAEPARIKPLYFPLGTALVPAWSVEVQVRKGRSSEIDAFHYVVAADDGRLLLRRDLTDYEAFNYRVWAEPDGDRRPLDGPTEDWTPHPTGALDVEGPLAFTPAGLVQVEGLNHNPNDLPDPWLAAGATETRGNNADAYVDWKLPDGLSPGEFRAPATGPATFDHTYDTADEPLADVTQSHAAVVQLFYDVNWLHDWWYDSGFVEATGVAQMLNYGRGGVEGDPIKAEAQDRAPAGARNDSNMVTPADGARPRMQMYLWTPRETEATLDVSPAGTVTAPLTARFGPKTFDTTASLVLVDDGAMTATDACEAPVNDLAGKIALVDRGPCGFEVQAKNVQAAGAVAVIIADDAGGDVALQLAGDNAIVDPTIPAIGVSQDDGAALKAALQQEAQTAHLTGTATRERDGALDNMVVAHEFGHYLHRRLQHCGTAMCDAMSEGWGDFNALMMALREGDDLDGTFADSTYAALDEFGYFGRRRVPYSADMTRNALTFQHVSDDVALPNAHPLADNGGKNSEAHNAGEIWATALWEAYTALQKADGAEFAAVNRTMSDYVVTAMMMAPDDATFTEQRDALLLAARANSEDDYLTVADAFARRGFGSCAVSPARTSVDLKGVVEDFELRANAVPSGQLTMSDDVLSCDDDGIVDIDEVGTLRIEVVNAGMLALPQGSQLEIVDAPAGLIFPDGPIATLAGVEPFAAVEAAIQVAIDPALPANDKVTVVARLTTPDGCQAPVDTPISVVINADLALDFSTADDFETTASVWEAAGDKPAEVWSLSKSFAEGSFWHGVDLGVKSDTFLVSPVLSVSDMEPFTIAFDHRFKFEFGDTIYWDGAVIEISEDAGATWNDVTTYGATPAYNGVIDSDLNPLHTRPVYGDMNPLYPEREAESLDFGMALAGKDVQFRFRIGTDSGASDLGWDIDNVVIGGITNTPFPGYVPDTGMCAAETESDTDSDSDSDTDSSTGDTDSDTTTDTSATDSNGDSSSSTTLGTTTLETDSVTPTTDATDDGPIPTSSASDGDESETDANSTGTGTETDPGEIGDDGCGCDIDEPRGWGQQLAPLLVLLGLGRRRRRA